MYTNIIMPYKEDTHPGVLLFATQTIPTTHNYGISFNASPKLGCWEPQLNVNMAFLDMNANKIGITEHRNQPRFYISLDNNFNLPKGWFRQNIRPANEAPALSNLSMPEAHHYDSLGYWEF